MDESGQVKAKSKLLWILLFCVLGIGINLLGAAVAGVLHLPLYLDSIGTILAAALGGYLPGIVVGLATNLLKDLSDPTSIFYGTLSVLMAVCTAFFVKKNYLKKPSGIIIFILLLSLIGGGLGFLLTWCLYGAAYEAGVARTLYQSGVLSDFQAALVADYLSDLADKAVSVGVVLIILKLLPFDVSERISLSGWQQAPLSEEDKEAAKHSHCRVISLRTKLILVLLAAALSISVVATSISFILYRNTTIDEHTRLGQGVAGLAASVIDPDKVDEYLEKGEQADGYKETEEKLYRVRASSSDIEYVYVYKIMQDGCHVVFDLDTEGVKGSEPGYVEPFDPSFGAHLPALLAGEPIDPIISNDSYGWLLTVYQPVYDGDGNCVCYAAADISMGRLAINEYSFLAKLVSLCLGFFILILFIGLWFAEYHIILPVNTMAEAAGTFAYNSEEARDDSVENIQKLDIHTGDELENLYHAFAKTTEESMKYVAELQNKTEMIAQMQDGLVMVLADMVESRDKNTGQHVRKTAAYVKIILEQMQKEGIYKEQLTEQFIYETKRSAPLHDVGKINIPDAILNKPGRLTDEEFATMKTHTTAGRDILERAIKNVPESGYLEEARQLAAHHHERWDGKGYPDGLAGEDIPLSARVMAVADVFDALVSKRSYKEGFPFEKALDIIREGVGSQFDPQVARAFLHAEAEVRKVAESFGEMGDDV